MICKETRSCVHIALWGNMTVRHYKGLLVSWSGYIMQNE